MAALDKGALKFARFVWDTVGTVVLCLGWSLVLSSIAFAYAGIVNGIGLGVLLLVAAFLIWQSGRLRRRSQKWETIDSRE